MSITKEHYERIADCFPRQRRNVSLDNLNVLNAILYVAKMVASGGVSQKNSATGTPSILE